MSTKKTQDSIARHFIVGLLYSYTLVSLILLGGVVYTKAYTNGYKQGSLDVMSFAPHDYLVPTPSLTNVLGDSDASSDEIIEVTETTPTLLLSKDGFEDETVVVNTAWNGNDLWPFINQKRINYGVNALLETPDLCTIADVRLNELITLGSLDGHAGFSSLAQTRPDLKSTFEKYASVSEFLQYGAQSASEAASLWENASEHSKVITSSEYKFGCVRARNLFAVAITAS